MDYQRQTRTDNYNQENARLHFNTLMDIICKCNHHTQDYYNHVDLTGQFSQYVIENNNKNVGPLAPFMNIIRHIKLDDKVSLHHLYFICYFKREFEIFKYEFSEYNFIRRYVNFIENEYVPYGPVEIEHITGFVDNFKDLFIALFGREPDSGLIDTFQHITQRIVIFPKKNCGLKNETDPANGYDSA